MNDFNRILSIRSAIASIREFNVNEFDNYFLASDFQKLLFNFDEQIDSFIRENLLIEDYD